MGSRLRNDPDQALYGVTAFLRTLPPFREGLFRGVVVLLPVVLTLWVLWILLNVVAGRIAQILNRIPFVGSLPYLVLLFLALIIVAVFLYGIGVLTTSYLGMKTLSWVENTLKRIPLARAVYTASQDAVHMLSRNRTSLLRPVVVPFPLAHTRAIGFLTHETPIEIHGKPHLHVFIPTTPNPTTGWYILYPEQDVEKLNISAEEALRWIVSGGLLLKEKELVDHETSLSTPRQTTHEG